MIKKSGKNYSVYTKDGTKKLGSHKTRKEAIAQLQAVEISKKKQGK